MLNAIHTTDNKYPMFEIVQCDHTMFWIFIACLTLYLDNGGMQTEMKCFRTKLKPFGKI